MVKGYSCGWWLRVKFLGSEELDANPLRVCTWKISFSRWLIPRAPLLPLSRTALSSTSAIPQHPYTLDNIVARSFRTFQSFVN